jgi:hypothetical protein
MKIIDTSNTITIEIELTHPDISPQFNTYLLDFSDGIEVNTDEIIQAFKNRFKNSYYHNMYITAVYVFDNEVYKVAMYEGGIL